MVDKRPGEAAGMDLKLGGLERTTTPEGVYRVLRAAILDGTVPPGGQLRERDIAADLGVSRSPLREALSRLEEEGLIVKIPFRGAFVMEVSAQDVAEIASVRLLVEPYAGELALEALRGPERPRLSRTIEEFHRATEQNDIPASIDAHLQFHRLFYDLSGHGVLRGLWAVGRPSCVCTSRSTIAPTATSTTSRTSMRGWRRSPSRETPRRSGGSWHSISNRRCEPTPRTRRRRPSRTTERTAAAADSE